MSTLGITPFFVENVSDLQLCAITLVTAVSLHGIHFRFISAVSFVFYDTHTVSSFLRFDSLLCFSLPQVFTRYEKHRQLILEEIFTSLARLPTNKRSLRSFRLLYI